MSNVSSFLINVDNICIFFKIPRHSCEKGNLNGDDGRLICQKVFQNLKDSLSMIERSCGNLKGKVKEVNRVGLLPVNSLNLIKLTLLEQGHRSTTRNFVKSAKITAW